MADRKSIFGAALEGKRVPTLTLDNKWYRLFQAIPRTSEIEALEKKQKELIKRQGKINTETGDLKKLKSRLMDEIVSLMEQSDAASRKKTEDNRRLIDEINEKLEGYQDEQLDLPREIDEVNRKLMVITMESCYTVIRQNTDSIDQLTGQIDAMRIQLKKDIVRRQEMDIRNVEMYSYMHDIFGPEVLELFDIRYDIEGKKQEILEKQRILREKKEQKGTP